MCRACGNAGINGTVNPAEVSSTKSRVVAECRNSSLALLETCILNMLGTVSPVHFFIAFSLHSTEHHMMPDSSSPSQQSSQVS